MKSARGVGVGLVFLAGAAGLACALAWDSLSLTFAGAFAAGAFVFGRLADRLERPLLLFGALQLALGAWAALGLPPLGQVVPAALLGGAFPAAYLHVCRGESGSQADLGRVVAAALLGAAAGGAIAAFWLIPAVGLKATIGFAVAVTAVVGVTALVIGRHALAPVQVAQLGDPSTPQLSQVLTGLVGVVVAAYLLHFAWFRVLTILLGGSAWSQALMLTAFLGSLGLGSLWSSRRRDQGDPRRLFAWLQLAAAGAVAITLPLYTRLPHAFWVSHDLLARSRDTWPVYLAMGFGACLAVTAPGFFLGASWPVGAALALGPVNEWGKRLGAATGFSLLGAIALPAWLWPLLPLEEAVVLAILVSLYLPATVLARRWRPIVLGALAVVAFVAATNGWSKTLAKTGAFAETGRPFASFSESVRASEVELYVDDASASVVVGHDAATAKLPWVRINGKVTASLAPSELETPLLLGQLGALLGKREPKQVLVLGGGSPSTLTSVLTHPVEKVEVVEASVAVTIAGRTLVVPDERVSVSVSTVEPRAWLATDPRKYDLIVAVPGSPWLSGASSMFTDGFYKAIAAHLAPDGVFVQSLHFADSSEALVQLWLRTVRQTFHASTTWGGDADLVLVSTLEPSTPDLAALAERMAVPSVHEDLLKIHLEGLATLLAKQVHTAEGQVGFAGAGSINTDDQNLLEFGSAKAFFLRARKVEVGDQRRRPGNHGLWIEQTPITAEDAHAIYLNLAAFHPKDEPLVRAAAERWLELAPEDPQAQTAAARAALLHGDVSVALARLGSASAIEATAGYLDAQRAGVSCCRTVWREIGLRRVPPRPPAGEARKAWDSLCEAAALEGCE